jgi:hypothetical protein
MSELLLWEFMIRAETATHVCRIWRSAGSPKDMTNEDLKKAATEMIWNEQFDPIDVAEKLVLVDKVNSVEIIRRHTGDGICVHKDWP